MTGDGFVRQDAGGVAYYASSRLNRLGWIRHGFSTRWGGVSDPPPGSLNLSFLDWDAADRVIENRRRLLNALGMDPASLLTLSQVHSDQVHIIEENPGDWNRKTCGDGLITALRGVAIAIQVADCFPILLVDPDSGAVAAIHAGWRGTIQGIAHNTILRMTERFASLPTRLLVAIGPGIRACCLEVGEEVGQRFAQVFPGCGVVSRSESARQKYQVDLVAALRRQMCSLGVAAENIFDLGLCTRCRMGEFFSFRKEGKQSGRMMGIISRTGA